MLDHDRASAWVAAHVPNVRPPVTFDLVAAGRSNLTFRVTDAAGGRWALRRPPTGPLLPTAHDMTREHRILYALARGTSVPVPAPVAECHDESVIGAPFFVMEWIDGTVLRDEDGARALSLELRTAAADSLVDTLVALHAVDPDEVQLGDLGRRDGYLERQLRRWRRQLDESSSPSLPALVEAHSRLAAVVPPQRDVAIVHGDYKIDNVVLDEQAHVVGVLDWELCTLGDPLVDLGLLLAYWRAPGDEPRTMVPSPTALDGFPSRHEVAQRYAEKSGRTLDDLDYSLAFAYWKLACIADGVHARTVAGSGGGDRTGAAGLAADVAWYADQALARSRALAA